MLPFGIIFCLVLVIVVIFINVVYTMLLEEDKKSKKKNLQISKKNILEQAKILFNQKKYGVVETLASKYLEAIPEHNELRELYAKTLYANNDIYPCIKQCRVLINQLRYPVKIKLMLVRCYKKINQYDKAIEELKDIINEDSNDIIALNELSNIYIEFNKKPEAIKTLKRLSELTENNKDLLEIHSKISKLNFELGDYAASYDSLKRILSIYPNDTDTCKKIIELYLKIQNYEQALIECTNMLKLNENTRFGLWLLKNMTNIFVIQKDSENVLKYAKKMLIHPFSDKRNETFVAETLLAIGQEKEGMELLNELSENDKDNIDIKRLKIATLERSNNYVAAIKLYKEILEYVLPDEVQGVRTDISKCFVKWARYLFENRDIQECFKIFALAISYDNTNPEIYYELGTVNAYMKKVSDAILQFKKAIRLKEDEPKYYIALADCYAVLENSIEQKNALLTAQKYDENNIDVLYGLAKVYNTQRDKINEKIVLEKIIANDASQLDAKYELAQILETRGDKQEALNIYLEIASINPKYKNIKESIKYLSNSKENEDKLSYDKTY